MKEVGRALLGSYNYNLAGPSSDKDYKVFMCPEFEDLYCAHKADKDDLPAETLENGELSVLDVRKLADLFCVGNVNATEYLFSLDYSVTNDFAYFWYQAQRLYEEGYLVVVWDKWFASLEGLVKNSLDRYGVSRKSMSRAYYFYMLAMTVLADNFRMNQRTWRENNWVDTVRDMRFNEENFLPSEELMYKNLEIVKKTGQKFAKGFNSQKKEELKKQAEQLKQEMKNFVKHELMEDMEDYD